MEPAASGPDTDSVEPTAPSELRRFDRLLTAVVIATTLFSIGTLLPGRPFEIQSTSLSLVLNTLTALAAAGAAALAWVRYRLERQPSVVFECSAFLVLFTSRALLLGAVILGSPAQSGLSLDAPQQWPIYAWTLARLVTAVLLILAASASLQGARRLPGPVTPVTLGPALVVLVVIAALPSVEGSLPRLLGPNGIDALRGASGVVPGMDPAGLAIQAIVALFYLRGAQLYREVYRDGSRQYAGYLSIALIVAAFSQLHWAILPGIYDPLVTADDLLRATFSIVLLLGIDAQSRHDARDLRLANARLHALRQADADRAALEASARLAREVHDGLSQDLWLAKLKQARLAQVPNLPVEAVGLTTELGDAVDRALGGARSILATMRTGSTGPTIDESLERAVEDFSERFGIRTEFTATGNPPELPSRTAAELLRIVLEALTNVHKHADATVVRVAADWDGATFEVAVADNGRGFEPAAGDAATYGIRGMRERAGLIGGALDIDSRPNDGTRVAVRIPLGSGTASG